MRTRDLFCVLREGDNKPYVLKVVNRLLPRPRHPGITRYEQENLELFQGMTGRAQPYGIVVLPNPFVADLQNSNPQVVISGILFEYYSSGTLKVT